MLQIVFYIFLILTSGQCCKADDLSEIEIVELTMSRATVRIVETIYAFASSTLFIIRAAAFPAETRTYQSDLLTEILLREQSNVVVSIEDYTVVSPNFLRSCNLIIIDSYEAFQ